MNQAEKDAFIQEFKEGCAKIEAAVAAIPGDHFVVVWCETALRYNPETEKIGLGVGGNIYHSPSRARMLQMAADWRDTVKGSEVHDNKVEVHTAQQWLVQVRIRHAELLEKMQPSSPKEN